MAQDPYRYFRIEARELAEQLGTGVLDVERDPSDPELVARLLRLAHTLKGAARVVKQASIAEHAHAIEDLLVPCREGGRAVAPDQVTALLELVDAVAGCVAAIPPAEPAPAPQEAAQPVAKSQPEHTEPLVAIRPEASDVDELLDAIGDTQARLPPLRRYASALEHARQRVELLAALVARGTAYSPADTARSRAIGAEIC
ncbi:MAG TPA: Hpt domain-containing protein, partial [Rugosimonospora sp.]|nr:Hpt domain-containing protein [Rugosimonospora sp.]